MKETAIQVCDLSVGYKIKGGEKVLARHINASIYKGELTCLLGANGAGKSTLLRTLSGFIPKLQGDVFVAGKEISTLANKTLSTVISVVLTDKCDLRNMTVTELVGLGRSPYTGFWGDLSENDKRVVEESIALVNIESLSGRMVHTLSDGERQKVMIAKALAQETPIVILDEPTAFLDFPSKVEIMQLLHRLTRRTLKTIFLSTHDLELALQMSDKLWLMDRKSDLVTGTPEDLSLEGYLSSFFDGRGIAFDMETGLYRIEGTYTSRIRLTGEGVCYSMIQKALQRNGIWADPYVDSEISIDSKNPDQRNIFIYKSGNEPVCVHSIDEMLGVVVS